MVKLATALLVLATTASVSWTGWRSPAPQPGSHAASADPLASDAAVRHRQCAPTHWRAYLLQPR